MPKRNVIEIVVEGEDKASGTLKDINKQLTGIGTVATTAVVAGLAAATAAIVGFGAAGLNEFNKFQQGMNEVFTLLPDLSAEAMGKLEDDVQSLNAEFGVMSEQSIPAIYQAISAGVPSDNVLDFMSVASKASIGGITSLETAVDGITSVVNAYGDDVIEAQKASDLMFTAVRLGKTDFDQLSRSLFQVVPTAASLGLEFGNVTAALASLTAQGTPTSVATTQLRQLLVELQKPTTKVSKLFEEMAGESFPAFIAKGGNMAVALDLIKKGADESDTELAALFGSVEALNAFLGLTGKNLDGFVDNLNEMANSAGATDEAFQTMAAGMQFKIDVLKARFQNILVDIGRALAPLADKFLDFAGKGLSALQGILDFLIEGDITTELLQAFGIAEDNPILVFAFKLRENFIALFAAIEAGVDPVQALTTLLGNMFGSDVAQGFTDFITGVQDFITEIARITKPIRDWIAENIELQDVLIVIGGIITAIILPAVIGFIATLAGLAVALAGPIAIVGGLILAVSALRQAWENDFGGIRTFIQETLLPALEEFGVWFTGEALPAIINFITNTAAPAFQSWLNILSSIWDVVRPALESLGTWFTESGLPAIQDFIALLIVDVQLLITIIGGIWENAQQGVVDLFNNLLRIFGEIRTTIIQPVIDAINSIPETINRIKGDIDRFFNGIGESIASINLDPFAAGGIFNPQGFQNGMPFVPRDMVVKVHRGEAIMPADQNPNVTTNNDNKTTNNITVNLSGGNDANQQADQFIAAMRAKNIELAR